MAHITDEQIKKYYMHGMEQYEEINMLTHIAKCEYCAGRFATGIPETEMIKISVNGNGFLYNMVRIIAGTLLEVGKGNVAPEQMEDIIKSADRKEAGPTAPAKGLKLVEIRYV